ncbi:MAG: hypothetical protein ACK46L_11125, partial [Synechococcaceae cyanobacterium]
MRAGASIDDLQLDALAKWIRPRGTPRLAALTALVAAWGPRSSATELGPEECTSAQQQSRRPLSG